LTVDQAEAEQSIVRSVSSLVGPCPIILAGSRATGEATSGSDYDVYVVLPARRALRHLRGLRRAGEALTSEIGVPVTLNPLPAFRLARPGHTLMVWKLRREGKVLGPPTFRLSPPWEPTYDDDAVSSYALSGLRYLVEGLEPCSLAEPNVSPVMNARVRKALRHVAQIELLTDRRYEPVLADALAALPSPAAARLGSLEACTDRSSTWFAVRDCLVERCCHPPDSLPRRFMTNAQYAALRTLRTHRTPLGPLLSSRSVSDQLGRALVELTLAVEPDGSVDDRRLRAAAALVPEHRDVGALSWATLRDDVDDRWADAHPLVGI
jgi:Nucleotidyltransferase domain